MLSALSSTDRPPLARTPLFDLHVGAGARMVGFAGYEMPVQYGHGVLYEHNHTRAQAGLFDVSHMGQALLSPNTGDADAALLMEKLVPGSISTLGEGRIRYTLLTHADGGIRDDLMVTRFGQNVCGLRALQGQKRAALHFQSCMAVQRLGNIGKVGCFARRIDHQPHVLARHIEGVDRLTFMEARWVDWRGYELLVSRCGYTGEDGFEISLPPEIAEEFAVALLDDDEVALIGLGARDSLRLEAGLCLYGHDIDLTTSPAEADLLWTIPKRRRESADYPGADIVSTHLASGAPRLRVGLLPDGRAPAREGTDICAPDGASIGTVTSGGFSPTLGRPVAMGYVAADYAAVDTPVHLMVRGRAMSARVSEMPLCRTNMCAPQNSRNAFEDMEKMMRKKK